MTAQGSPATANTLPVDKLDSSPVPVVFMSSTYPSPALELLLIHPMNKRRMKFFVGSVKAESDLLRVGATKALVIFILDDSDPYLFGELSYTSHTQDFNTKLKVVSCINHLMKTIGSAKKHAKPLSTSRPSLFKERVDPPQTLQRPVVIAQATAPEACYTLLNYGVDRMIELTTIKYAVLAYGAMFPGFMAILHALAVPLAGGRTTGGSGGVYGGGGAWREEVRRGHSFDIHEIPVGSGASEEIKRLTFSQLCKFLYNWSGGSVVCVGVFGWRGSDYVIVNPERSVEIGDCRSLFVICDNLEVASAMLQAQNIGLIWQRLNEDLPGSPSSLSSPEEAGGNLPTPKRFGWEISQSSSYRRGAGAGSSRGFSTALEVCRYEERCVGAAGGLGGDTGLLPTLLGLSPRPRLKTISSQGGDEGTTSGGAVDQVDPGQSEVNGGGSATQEEEEDNMPPREIVFQRDKSSIRVDTSRRLSQSSSNVSSTTGGEESQSLSLEILLHSSTDQGDPSPPPRDQLSDLPPPRAPSTHKPPSLPRATMMSRRNVLGIPVAEDSGGGEGFEHHTTMPRPRQFDKHGMC